jgi:allantoin racemase
MRILVINPNTDEAMTDAIASAARAYARPDTTIVAHQPDWGPVALDGYTDGVLAAAAVVEKMSTSAAPVADAVILAGVGDPGATALREMLEVPVFDIAECGAHLACLLGRRFGVLTTLDRGIPPIEDLFKVVGLWERCAGVRAIDVETHALADDPALVFTRLVEEGRAAIDRDRAEVLVLGCGGMGGLDKRLAHALGVPVVDGIVAAVKLAESCVDYGITTSRARSYAPRFANAIRGRSPI